MQVQRAEPAMPLSASDTRCHCGCLMALVSHATHFISMDFSSSQFQQYQHKKLTKHREQTMAPPKPVEKRRDKTQRLSV